MLKTKVIIFCYLLLVLFVAWVCVTGARMYSFTKNTERLITNIQPYQQNGIGTRSILFIGDSFAYGTGASSSDSTMAGLLGKRFPDITIENKARNGTKAEDLASRIDADINKSYDTIFIIVGANDIIHPEVSISNTRSAYRTIYAKASASAVNVIAITATDFKSVSFFLWPLNNYFSHRSQLINTIAKDEARKLNNITYIDVTDDRGPMGGLGILESADHLHPSDLGYHYWTQEVLRTTNELSFNRS